MTVMVRARRTRTVRRRWWSLMALVSVLPVMASCASLGPDPVTAGTTAAAFHRAITDRDGAAACALLAPETLAEVEQTTGDSCDQAILTQDLPDAQSVQDSQAFGRGAQVVLDGDVLFLAVFDGQWRVTAAGCEPDGNRPYDCTVKGS